MKVIIPFPFFFFFFSVNILLCTEWGGGPALRSHFSILVAAQNTARLQLGCLSKGVKPHTPRILS